MQQFNKLLKKKLFLLTILLLFAGAMYRLDLTSHNNFLFNMDNARDFVDVREMVVLQKPRLIGPTSAIEGVYTGPAWYYLLAIPFILTSGDPYGGILMQIVLWAIGGFFLFKLLEKYGIIPLIFALALWIYSNFIVLANLYTFNPNPVLFLTPLFIYLLKKYIETNKLIYSLSTWFLGGLFLNFEINFGIFIPLIILASLILCQKLSLLKEKNFWLGLLAFIVTILPQAFFDLRHDFIMTNSLFRYLSNSESTGSNFITHSIITIQKFYNVFTPTFLNFKFLFDLLIILFTTILIKYFIKKRFPKDYLFFILIAIILIPFLGYIVLPVTVNPWHLGAEAVAAVILSSIILREVLNFNLIGKAVAFTIFCTLLIFIGLDFKKHLEEKTPSQDVSNFKNELRVVDYVYQKADGKNFKVYTYLPSIIDYPYQYLFWWRGLQQYGYVPEDYAYLPNQPPYIANKAKLPQGKNPSSSNLIFLIKEPDRINIRHLWENSFKNLPLILAEKVGPLEVEIRQDLPHN